MDDSKKLNETKETLAAQTNGGAENTAEASVDETNPTSTKAETEAKSTETVTNGEKAETTKETEVKSESTSVSEEKETVEEPKKVLPLDPKDDDMELYHMDKDFIYDMMSVPTHSKLEYRMVAYIIMWARRNHIKYEFDAYGNVYLTKGVLAEGEYYPCVTSHLDTVQDKQDPYIFAGVRLDLKTERVEDKVNKTVNHKLSVDAVGGSSIGIGADDKGGICICLSLFAHVDKLKACFFLDEETGCHGSDNLDKEWFEDVSYVIGFDSPDLFRAARACSGVRLFDYKFYETYMKPTCDAWGYKDCFFSEPYTDVKNIREKTNIICMNFGNGGYNAHAVTEYTIIEDMDYACGLGEALIEAIDTTKRHILPNRKAYEKPQSKYTRTKDGIYIEQKEEDDEEKLAALGDSKRRTYSPYYGSGTHTTTHTPSVPKADEIKFETVKYIVARYDTYIANLKDEIIEAVKGLCTNANVDSAEFETAIASKFGREIKF